MSIVVIVVTAVTAVTGSHPKLPLELPRDLRDHGCVTFSELDDDCL